MASRKKTVAVEFRAETGKLDSDMRKAERIVDRRARGLRRKTSRLAGGGMTSDGRGARQRGEASRRMMGKGASAVGGYIKGALAFGGFYGMVGEVQRAKAFEETLVDLAVRGRKSKQWVDRLRKSIIGVSNQYGIGKEKIAEYVQFIIDKTGNTKLATQSMKDMAAVSYSTNADIGRLAGTMKDLSEKLGIDPKDAKEAFGILAAQADKGAVALDQMDAVLPEVLSKATMFGHKGTQALRDYGAAMQMAVRSTSSVAEASTAVQRAMDAIATKRVAIEKALGVKLKVGKQWKGLGEIMQLISAKLAEVQKNGGKINIRNKSGRVTGSKDVEGWMASTFGVRGMKMILPYLAQARVGFGSSVGGLSSLDAITGAGGASTIDKRVALKRKLNPGLDNWNRAITKFRNSVHKHMLPVLDKLSKNMPAIGKALTFLVDNFKTLAMIWASNSFRNFFSNMRRSYAAGGGGGGGGAGGGGGYGGYGGYGGRRGRGGRRRGGKGLKYKGKRSPAATPRMSRGEKFFGAMELIPMFAQGYMAGNMISDAFFGSDAMKNQFSSGSLSPTGKFTAADMFGSDDDWEYALDKKLKERTLFKQSGFGESILRRNRKKWVSGSEGKTALTAYEGMKATVEAALASGDSETIKRAREQAYGMGKQLFSSEKGMVNTLPGYKQAWVASTSQAQRSVVNPEARAMVAAVKDLTAELRALPFQKLITETANAALTVLTTKSRSKR